MTLAEVIALINSDIVPNGNNEITANVLRPILIEMLQQPNDLIGELDELNTIENDTLVKAINSINNALSDVDGLTILSGQGDPNGQSFPSLSIADLYSEIDGLGSPLALWIYDGTKFIRLSDKYLSYEIPQVLTPTEQLTARTNIGAVSLEDVRNLFRIPSSDIITGANIHFFDTLKVSWLDIQSNKFVFPTPETFYNKICVSISGEEYGYTGGVVSLENVSQSNKNSLESRLNQGICIAVAIYNADTDSFVGTGTRNPKTIYDERVANPELKYIRIGSFFKNGNDYFFDVNPGII